MAETHDTKSRAQHRRELRAVVPRRPRVGPVTAILLSAGFALIGAVIVLADTWAVGSTEIVAGRAAPVTVRVAQFSSAGREELGIEGGPVVVAYGDTITDETAPIAAAALEDQQRGGAAWLAYFGALFFLALLFTTHARQSHDGKLLRTQLVTLMMLLGVAALFKGVLLYTPMSLFIIPVAGIAVVTAIVVDHPVGLSVGLIAAALFGFLVPFDLGVVAVLAAQGAAAVLVLGEGRSRFRRVFLSGVFGGAVAAATYVVLLYLTGNGGFASEELADPLRSPLLAAAAGGALSGLLAYATVPVFQLLLGDITKAKLVELADLSNPMLEQIAENSPGTWQHSLAMANMAEIAAKAIGADGRLVRVGAYYHDLGKSLQSKYFIENLAPGETSPHDRLPPEVSCDAIFAHVTEGIQEAKKRGLPDRIIDFMHMHHGDGLLEYFWAKCREQGNPNNLSEEDFRYPGIKPQSRETAILAICDAVEAASRTLKNPDERTVASLVQRIVYGKLHLGQLDESGLSMADLRKISNSLRETIKHAHHGRIEYPWQREERAREERTTSPERPVAEVPPAEAPAAARAHTYDDRRTATQRIMREPRLDSLDIPRPYWRDRARTPNPLETAATERVASNTPVNAAPEAPSVTPAPVPVPESTPAPESTTADTVALQREEAQRRAQRETEPAPLPVAREHTPPPALIVEDNAPPMPEEVAPELTPPEPTPPPAHIVEELPAEPRADTRAETVPVADEDEHDAKPRPKPPAQVLAELVASARREESKVADVAADEVTRRHKKRTPPPPPGSPARAHRPTIELMKETSGAAAEEARDAGDDAHEDGEPGNGARPRRESDGELTPGTMVIGPPPATRPGSPPGDAEPDEGEARPAASMMPPRSKRET